jgi:hypothetical protein
MIDKTIQNSQKKNSILNLIHKKISPGILVSAKAIFSITSTLFMLVLESIIHLY